MTQAKLQIASIGIRWISQEKKQETIEVKTHGGKKGFSRRRDRDMNRSLDETEITSELQSDYHPAEDHQCAAGGGTSAMSLWSMCGSNSIARSCWRASQDEQPDEDEAQEYEATKLRCDCREMTVQRIHVSSLTPLAIGWSGLRSQNVQTVSAALQEKKERLRRNMLGFCSMEGVWSKARMTTSLRYTSVPRKLCVKLCVKCQP